MEDVNRAFVSKLAWMVCKQMDKPWVQLVRAKYLSGRRILDPEHTKHVSSWIWGGITNCLNTLQEGVCFQVGKNPN